MMNGLLVKLLWMFFKKVIFNFFNFLFFKKVLNKKNIINIEYKKKI